MGIRTPQQYLDSLRDDRVVYCQGERVEDVTRHPILRICADWQAMDFVLHKFTWLTFYTEAVVAGKNKEVAVALRRLEE